VQRALGVERALECPLHVVGGAADPLVTLDDLLGWQQHSTREVEPMMLPGGHFYLRDDEEQLLHHLRPLLRRCLVPDTAARPSPVDVPA